MGCWGDAKLDDWVSSQTEVGQCKVFQEVQHPDLAFLFCAVGEQGTVPVVGKLISQLACTPLQLKTLKARR